MDASFFGDQFYASFITYMACNDSDDPESAIQQFYDALVLHTADKAHKFDLHVDEMIMS